MKEGNIIRSEQVSNDMYVSIDLVEEVIERQLCKYKIKSLINSRQPQTSRKSIWTRIMKKMKRLRLSVPRNLESNPCIRKMHAQMELLGHNFFVFFNAETEQAQCSIQT